MDLLDDAKHAEEQFLQEAIGAYVNGRRLGTRAGDGNCVGCGEKIPTERRAAVPNAERCIDCQARLEGGDAERG